MLVPYLGISNLYLRKDWPPCWLALLVKRHRKDLVSIVLLPLVWWQLQLSEGAIEMTNWKQNHMMEGNGLYLKEGGKSVNKTAGEDES